MTTSALLDQNLPPNRKILLSHVSRLAAARGLPAYLAGGFVRDALLGFAPDDFDVVLEGDAPAFARALAGELGGEVTVHAPFGTATWTGPDGATVDCATARTETYARPAALPSVVPADIEADLRRRDFSVNAMAVRLDGQHRGELLDPFNGQADLAARLVRVLHPASFVDDPTRILRAARYAARLGFEIAPETRALIPGAWEALAALTPDRLRHEFELVFREGNPSVTLTQLAALDILKQIHPALHWGQRQTELAQALPGLPISDWHVGHIPEPDVFYFTLLLGDGAPTETAAALARLNPNRAVSEAVQAATALQLSGHQPSEVVRAVEAAGELAAMAAYVLRPEWRAELNSYLSEWRFVQAELDGNDLARLGVRPGPDFKRILWELRAARLDGKVFDRGGEMVLVKRWSQAK